MSPLDECITETDPETSESNILVIATPCPAIDNYIQYLEMEGFFVNHVATGSHAVQFFQETSPDLVIIDTDLENLAEQASINKLRDRLDDDKTPFIFMIDDSTENRLDELVVTGRDDFIRKPFHYLILLKRIKSLLYLRVTKIQREEKLNEVKEFVEDREIEQETAAALYRNIVDLEYCESPNVRFDLSPMSIFNGDLVLVAYTPSNKLHVFLGDFTGHGITASVASIPTSEIFYGMSRKGFGLCEIVEEINNKLKKQLPAHMFLAATAVGLDSENRTLQTITCGLPNHILYDEETGEKEIIGADALPLGVLNQHDLNLVERHHKITDSQCLILFTDGVVETENKQGQAFGFHGVLDGLSHEGDRFDNILRAMAEFRGTKDQQDDITLVKIDCDLSLMPSQENNTRYQNTFVQASSWKLNLHLEAESLKQYNPVQLLLDHVVNIQGLAAYREKLFVILTELFINALDHGLLGLDSQQKQSVEGFSQYFERKQQRLEQLKNGSILIDLSHRRKEGGGELTICVKDSGDGFSGSDPFIAIGENNSFSGRGIALVKECCDELRYSEGGTKVTAVFCW